MTWRRTIAALWLALSLTTLPAAALATTPRASLGEIEGEVMCPSCREPLTEAQSPQALAERNFIRTLIAQGKTKPQIEQALVAQYGPAVLGRPPAGGFNLTVYVLPPALIVIAAVALSITLPRWRRRARARTQAPEVDSLSPAESQRLEADLARFER